MKQHEALRVIYATNDIKGTDKSMEHSFAEYIDVYIVYTLHTDIQTKDMQVYIKKYYYFC